MVAFYRSGQACIQGSGHHKASLCWRICVWFHHIISVPLGLPQMSPLRLFMLLLFVLCFYNYARNSSKFYFLWLKLNFCGMWMWVK
jgi:hypothetical protein